MAGIGEAFSAGASRLLGSAAAKILATTFSDAGSLVASLFDGAEGSTRQRLENLKADIDRLEPAAPFVGKVAGEIATAKKAAERMADAPPHLIPVDFAQILIALGNAIDHVADAAAELEGDSGEADSVRDAIKGIKTPWQRPFLLAGEGMSNDFDEFARAIFGIENGTKTFLEGCSWDRETAVVKFTIKRVKDTRLPAGSRPGEPSIAFTGGYLEVYFDLDEPKLGLGIHTTVEPELTAKETLGWDLPGDRPKTSEVLVELDTKDGLTFGGDKGIRILVPVRAGHRTSEVRDLLVSVDEPDSGNRIDVTATVASRLGPVMGVVAEGLGVSLRWQEEGGFTTLPRPPDGMGISLDAGIVHGGGYIRYREREGDYAGIVDIAIGPIRGTAIGLLDPDPFSFVIIIGIRFRPAIELGFGFTLNGLGGLCALNRRFAEDALRKALSDGVVSNLLFPDNPIAVAPTILDQLGAVFPYQSGSFVIGPIAELGWGSQTGLIRAKMGLVLSFPGDGALTLIGALSVTLKASNNPNLKLVDLNVETITRIDSESLSFQGVLRNSKIADYDVSGEMRAYICWGANPMMALSAGGFHPRYTPAAPLQGMKRITVSVAPPIKAVTLTVSGYLAVTSNSVHWGGEAHLKAKIGPVTGEGRIGIDALFQWSPTIHFDVGLYALVSIKAWGHSVASVSFSGQLSGPRPWSLRGYASVGILVWDAELPIGPITWGDRPSVPVAVAHPVELVAAALGAPTAWRPLMPEASDALVRLSDRVSSDSMIHPLAAFEVRQMSVPLEVEIDRIADARASERWVYLSDPKINQKTAGAASVVTDGFPMGQYLDLTDDQRLSRPDFEQFQSGVRITAQQGASIPDDFTEFDCAWESIFPQEPDDAGPAVGSVPVFHVGHALSSAAATRAHKKRSNAYVGTPVAEIAIAEPGLRQVVEIGDLKKHTDGFVTVTEATRVASRLVEFVQLLGMGGVR